MFNREEEELNTMKEGYKNIDIPENIDDFIQRGMCIGKKYKRRKKARTIIGYAASLLIVIMLITIRVSPVFAEMMSNIPGIEYIVKLINYDKVLQLAVENDFLQHVGVSDEHENIIFTVEDIIVDESQMFVFYSIENKSDYDNIGLNSPKFLDEEGNKLKGCYSWSPEVNEDIVDGKQLGKIDVSYGLENTIPDKLTVSVKLCVLSSSDQMIKPIKIGSKEQKVERKELDSTWEVKVPIDKEKFENLKETYSVNQEVLFGNQKVYFKQITLYPTRVALDVEYDENNTKKIFGLENLRLVDENTEWETVSNGVTATYPSENSVRLYLESNYFTKPESIYIAADGIRALGKDELEIKIDLENEELFNPPDDKLKFIRVDNDNYNNDKNIILEIACQNLMGSSVSFDWYFKDANGNEFECQGIGFSEMEEGYDQILYTIPNQNYVGPITLKITDYPSVIKKDIKIKVK